MFFSRKLRSELSLTSGKEEQQSEGGNTLAEVMEPLTAKSFVSRHSTEDFQLNLREALKDYRLTLETVISSRGYSLSSITLTRPPMSSRLLTENYYRQ